MRDMNGNVCALQSRQDGKVKFSVFHGCVFVCVGEIPHSIEGDVFIDVDDDEQPLMPDQVEPAADTHTHRDFYIQYKCISVQGTRQRKSMLSHPRKRTVDYIRLALIMQ